MQYVVDLSVIANRMLTKKVMKGEVSGEIIVPRELIDFIEHEARRGNSDAISALEELKILRKLEKEGRITLNIESGGDFTDLSIRGVNRAARKLASKNGRVLLTSDFIQASIAELEKINTRLIAFEGRKRTLEEFFDKETMSIHLKEGCPPMAKKGKPGEWRLVKISDEPLSREELEQIALDIVERAGKQPQAFIEIDEGGATVIQLSEYRIVIAKPPFSERLEITAVRPLLKVSLAEYDLPKQLIDRLEKRAEGILIAGPPGAGKTTFAQALAEWYASRGKIVKTMERPRDLRVPPEVSQYTALGGDMAKTANVLLLVRPDFTIFDEMRTTKDFEIFVDMRLAGVGMIGVCHASSAIDAIQRFIGRVDLGVIPQVVDTVIFIEDGRINKVYTLEMVTKVPSGFTDTALARPVIEVRDLMTRQLEYEIYSFGEEVIVMPVTRGEEASWRLGKHTIILSFGPAYANRRVAVYADGEFLFTAFTDNRGRVEVEKSSKLGRKLKRLLLEGAEVKAYTL